MSSEQIDPSSGDEPLLLTRASLEHVLDAFPAESGLVEEADSRSAAARAASLDLFASEEAAVAVAMPPLALQPPAPMTFPAAAPTIDTASPPLEDERPWHTYQVQAPSDAPATAVHTPVAVGPASQPRFTPKMLAATVLTLVAVGAVAIGGVRQRLSKIEVASAEPAAASSSAIDRPATAVSDAAAGSIPSPEGERAAAAPSSTSRPAVESRPADAATPGLSMATPAKPVSPLPANPTGRVLKGSLTPQVDATTARAAVVSRSVPREVSAPAHADTPPAITPEPRETAPTRADEPRAAAEPPRPAPGPAAPSPAVSESTAGAHAASPPVPSAAPALPPAPPPSPTSSAASSAPAPPPAATSIAAATDANAIEGVLGRYRHAFSELNPDAAKAVWPSVDARMLGRAFDQLQQQELDFQACEIAVNGTRATASCSGRARYVPKVGSKSARDESRHWTFNLRKVGEQWLIDGVASK